MKTIPADKLPTPYLPAAEDFTAAWASPDASPTLHRAAADHHAARAQTAREAKNHAAKARHQMTVNLHLIAYEVIFHGATLTDDLNTRLKDATRQLDALHVQAREAVERDLSADQQQEKRAAYDHYNTIFKALRRAIKKGGTLPGIEYYGTPLTPTPAQAEKPAPAAPSAAIYEEDIEGYYAFHQQASAADPSPEARAMHKTLMSAWAALLGYNAKNKPHKGNARARYETAQEKYGPALAAATGTFAASLAALAARTAKTK